MNTTMPDFIAKSADGAACGYSDASTDVTATAEVNTTDKPSLTQSETNICTYFNGITQTQSNEFKSNSELQHMAKNPLDVPKESAPCISPQTSGFKKKDIILEHFVMALLWVDIDTGNRSIKELKALLATLGILNYIVHSTATSMRLNKQGTGINGKKWRILIQTKEPIKCDKWVLIQQSLIKLLDGDKHAASVQQILFVPNNPKVTDPREYQHYEFHIENGPIFDINNLSEAIRIALEAATMLKSLEPVIKRNNYPNTIQLQAENIDIERIISAAAFINSDLDYDEWIKLGMVLAYVFDKGAIGEQIFIQLSEHVTKTDFSVQVCKKKYKTFDGRNTTTEIIATLGTFYWHAKQGGWDGGYTHNDSDTAPNQKSLPEISDMSWTTDFITSDEEMDAIADPEWLFPNLIIKGHLGVYPAPPNGGKTTIFMWVCSQLPKDINVFYVNADVSGTDAKQYYLQAKRYGITLMLPDLKTGLSMQDVVDKLDAMNNSNMDLSNILFIFDTLKKMTDVINKSQAKKLYKTLRGLTAKGMTVILLGHTNKYKGKDGELIFEGTGDLRADVDEMIYLIPQKHDDGSMTVSTKPDKVRGDFSPITFEISPLREVSLSSDYIDVAAQNIRHKNLEEDSHIIEAINAAIDAEETNQSKIIKYCKDVQSIGSKTVKRVLNEFSFGADKLWDKTTGGANNSIIYAKVKVEDVDVSFLYED